MTHPPSVDQIARSLQHHGLPHPILVEIARKAIAADQLADVDQLAIQRKRQLLTPVINGTGVLLHTNLGRAPVGADVPASYSNLELSLETGQRGSRQRTIGDTMATLCGAESAMVVNNCAGAVLLTLAALGAGRGVAVSRGEMVEIGGGFRIPDVMNQSGARLVEVGTTNRSRLSDFTAAKDADPDLAMVLKVHRSNYEIVGFTEEVSVAALTEVGVPVVADIGSGLLDAACPWLDGPPPGWLADEPAAKQTLEAGADLVLFSGDKLLGGPQAGIIAGSKELVEKCGSHPLARALRPGGLVMHALQSVALSYLERRGNDIPFWRMVEITQAELQHRAERILEVGAASTSFSELVKATKTKAVPGGGTLPTVSFPSYGLSIKGDVTAELRANARPIIARIEQGKTYLDLRTVHPDDDVELTQALGRALKTETSPTEGGATN